MAYSWFESLEGRRVFASVAGTVWGDADASGTFDAGESATRGVTVFVDANANGRPDRGEPQTASGRSGEYRFDDLPAGDVLIGVVAPAGQGQTTPGRFGAAGGGFDIELTGLDDLSATVRQAFAAAAARWESIITGDLPDFGSVDDLRINVTLEDIDGPGGTLAQAQPTATRGKTGLPYRGEMEFDESDVDTLIADNRFVDTVTHEMAHVLGFGTIWSAKGLLVGEGTRNPRFLGREATREYNALFSTIGTSVPVESGGGRGTAGGHWPEASFARELMTGFAEDGGANEPLSRVTVGSLADLGYAVNLRAADVWDPIAHTSTRVTSLDSGARAFQRRVTLGRNTTAEGLDFGFRAGTAPRVGTFTAADATLGTFTALSARNITDAEGDAIAGVGFYADSNGLAGLQRGRGGDTFLGDTSRSRRGAWTINAFTGGLAAGEQAFYAIATDALGFSGRRGTTATLVAPPPPTRPNPVVATLQSRTTSLLQWRDRSADEIGFRIEVSNDPQYATILRAFNVPADSASALVDGLSRGTTYHLRIRAYGYGGASAYTRLAGVRV